MVKEWATVVRWHNGRAILQHSSNSSCRSCAVYLTCISYVLNKIDSKIEYQLEIEVNQPLLVGQKIELGITEVSLLSSAIFVYFTPLIWLFIGGLVMKFFFLSQFIIFLGAIIGVSIGFFLAKKNARYLEKNILYHTVILQIDLPSGEFKELFKIK